jgi:malonyl CoA-acyl carrier protein transacylase
VSPSVIGLFPGQGSHTSGLREQVARTAPELLERCLELVGEDPFELVAESTRYAQPAIFCASVARWTEVHSALQPVVLAGHSLGELSALVAAEALDPLTGLELAVARGELMARAAEEQPDQGMLALLKASLTLADELAREYGVVIANDNAPGQLVLAGPGERLRAVQAVARERGARAMMLDVAGAFHSPAMAPAVEPFQAELARVEFAPARVPVVCGATAAPFADPAAELAAGILSPVRWRETMAALGEAEADGFLDLGPGTVLARLVPRNLPEAAVLELEQLTETAGVG